METLPAIIKVFILTTLSFLVAMSWTPAFLRFLYKHKLGKQIRAEVAAPIFYKFHAQKSGTPTMGGVLIWVTTLVLALVFFYLSRLVDGLAAALNFLTRGETLLPLGALVASALVGLADDFLNVRKIGPVGGGMRMRHRILMYTLIASFGAYWFYFKLDWDLVRIPFIGDFNIGLWYIPFAIFIIVATAFSVNQTDGLDGLAGGTLLSAFAAYGAIAFHHGRFNLAAFCGIIAGALLAFLWFNINPAKFFMGDTGAMSLGVTLGVVAMLTNSVLLLPIIGMIFVLESITTLTQVFFKKVFKRKIFLSSPIHHHLQAIGWPEPQIVMRFWVISAVAAVVGLILSLLDKL